MIDIELVKRTIVEKLMPLNPEKIILFGSYAYGTPTEDSDIDLYVVTKDVYIPKSYDEKRRLVRKVSNSIKELREKYSIDLIVHTKTMEQDFVQQGDTLSKDIITRGVSLI
jgi:predicted nucleotidyltransferase